MKFCRNFTNIFRKCQHLRRIAENSEKLQKFDQNPETDEMRFIRSNELFSRLPRCNCSCEAKLLLRTGDGGKSREGLATTHHSFLSSFSAVSTATIARNGAFFHIFRDLQDFHAFAPLRTQNFKKIHHFCQNLANFPKFCKFC